MSERVSVEMYRRDLTLMSDRFIAALEELNTARLALAAMRVERDRAIADAGWHKAANAGWQRHDAEWKAERDRLREALMRIGEWAKHGWHRHTRDGKPCDGTVCWLTDEIDAALAPVAVEGGSEGQPSDERACASTDAPAVQPSAPSRADLEAVRGGGLPECVLKSAPPCLLTPSRADLLALVEAGVRAGVWEPRIHPPHVAAIAVRVLAAWESRAGEGGGR